MDFQVLKRLFKNYLRVNHKKILLFVLIYISLFLGNYVYFFNEKIENPQKWYQNIYYILLFIYSPFSYFSMEEILRNKEINYLNNFGITNKILFNYLSIKVIIKSFFLYLFILLLFLPLLQVNINLFLSFVTQLTVYHFIFVSISFFVYGQTSKFIIDDEYEGIKKVISGGWTDPKIAPLLFAPAVIFTTVNVINILNAKITESMFFDVYVDKTILYITIFLIIPLFMFGRKELIKRLKTVYAVINSFQYLYQDGNYKSEKSFFEMKLFNNSKLKYLIYKDLVILKRKYRLNTLISYIIPVIIFFLVKSNIASFQFNLMIILIYIFGIMPIIKLYLKDEQKVLLKMLPVGRKDVFAAKSIVAGLYFFPYLISIFIIVLF